MAGLDNLDPSTLATIMATFCKFRRRFGSVAAAFSLHSAKQMPPANSFPSSAPTVARRCEHVDSYGRQVCLLPPRSGRGGRRFKSCHSDQYLAEFSIVAATDIATETARAPTGRREPLIPLKPKVGDPQACGVVAHHALHILRETFGGFSVDIKRQCHRGASDTIQLAQDRLGDIADLRCRPIGVERDLGIEATGPRAGINSRRRLYDFREERISVLTRKMRAGLQGGFDSDYTIRDKASAGATRQTDARSGWSQDAYPLESARQTSACWARSFKIAVSACSNSDDGQA
jgi:hypothetical protein